MTALQLKPAHKAVKAYFDELNAVAHLDFYDEGAVSPAFAALLRHCGRQSRLTLVEKYPLTRGGRNLRVDGALVDTFKIPHGYWEAKDTKDDLEKEIHKKFEAGYPRDNILFQAPHRPSFTRMAGNISTRTSPNRNNSLRLCKPSSPISRPILRNGKRPSTSSRISCRSTPPPSWA